MTLGENMLPRSYLGVGRIFQRYWRLYGGFSALIGSPYLHLSMLLSALIVWNWQGDAWYVMSLDVIPSVLGLTFGGYAIWLAVGDEQFRVLMSRRSNSRSPFMSANAAFVHFIVVQFLALLAAVMAKSGALNIVPATWYSAIDARLEIPFSSAECIESLGAWVGCMLFLYALFSALAATMAIFRVASWYDEFVYRRGAHKKPNKDTKSGHG